MSALFASLTLSVGSTGALVTLLQSQLLQLHYANKPKEPFQKYISSAELATASFGPTTRIAVLTFQKDNQDLLVSAPSGNVDKETATILSTKLAQFGIDIDRPQIFFVAGRVQYADGSPGLDLSVSLYDKDLHFEKLLFSASSEPSGFFAASFTRSRINRGETGRLPTLSTRVSSGRRVIFVTELEDIIYEAKALTSIEVRLEQRPPSAPSPDDFTQMVTALDTALPPAQETTPMSSTQTDSLGKRIRGLREDEKSRDLTYLSRLKATSFSKSSLTNIVLAHRMADLAATDDNVSVPAEMLYALLATDVYRDIASPSPQNLGQADLDLETPVKPLMYQMALLDESIIKNALEKAVIGNHAPSSVISGDLIRNWRKIRIKAVDWINTKPTLEDTIWIMIQDFLESGKEQAVRGVLSEGNLEGDLFGFIERLVSAFSKKAEVVTPLATRGVEESEIRRSLVQSAVEASVKRLKSSPHEKGLGTLAEADILTLSKLIADESRDRDINHDHPAVQEAAAQLATGLAKEFPSRAFRASLRRFVRNANDLDTNFQDTLAGETVQKQGFFGAQSLAIDGQAVVNFLDACDDFDLQRSNLAMFRAKATVDDQTFASIAKVQRVFKLAPTFEKTRHLLDKGIHCSSQIANLSRAQFLVRFANGSHFTTSDAEETYSRAVHIQLAVSHLAGNIQGVANALRPTGVSEPVPPAKIEALFKNFPNMASLFQTGDICACSDCMTVYSPSAYLVDVLEFLKNRHVLESLDGPDAGRTARDVLLLRRPDLADLDLSCNNTNVTLPLIDLVCELLEDIVSPDGLSPGSFTGTIIKGKISTPLLLFLRDDLKLPFTDGAIVSDTYSGGFRTVRDKSFLVSLSPVSQKVKVLRQTYGDSVSLNASPAYVNSVAYERLSTSTFLPALPFSLDLEECRAYLRQLGVPRLKLMEVLAPKAAYNNAIEFIGFSLAEAKLVTKIDESGQEKYWNSGDPLNIVGKLENVLTFVSTARIEYTDLQTLLAATGWVNPPAVPPANAGVERIGVMFIKHKDDSCTLKEKVIKGLDNKALDRLHRFTRLWRKLSQPKSSGWSAILLDRFIASAKLGAGKLDEDCIASILAAAKLSIQMSSSSPTTIEDIVNVFSGLPIVFSSENQSSSSQVTYNSVFLNPSATGTVDSDFEIRNIALNDSPTPPTVIPRLLKKAEYISRSLGVTGQDTERLIKLVAASQTDPLLTLNSLFDMYAIVFICRRCSISVEEYGIISNLSGLNPLGSLNRLNIMTTMVANMRVLGLSGSDNLFLTQPPKDEKLPQELPEETMTQIITEIQVKYKDVATTKKSPFNDGVPSAENHSAALALLSQIEGVSQVDLTQFQRMLNGELTASNGAALIHKKLDSINDTKAVADIVQAQAALAASPTDEALRKKLVRAVSDNLSEHFASLERNAKLAEVLQYFEMDSETLALVLKEIKLMKPMLDKNLATGKISRENNPDQYKAVSLLHKLAFLVDKAELSKQSVEWLLFKANKLAWADIQALPVIAEDTPIPWNAWESLLDYILALKTSKYPSITNTGNKTSPYSLNGLFDLILTSETEVKDAATYFSKLIGEDEEVVADLIVHFGFTKVNLMSVSNLRLIEEAALLVRKSRLETPVAIGLAKAEVPQGKDVSAVRETLQSLYAARSDWLTALKTIQDPLRVRKRDALIDFILAGNKTSIVSAKDISEILLMDVEMGVETITSRIIQAHQSVQQFAQRLLMGLEPTPIVSDDPFWSHWTEMSQYRLWEANKKVFLYPEMWIEPELRDNKSELYSELEDSLKKQPITPTHVERIVGAYLDELDHIADLEVMSTFYDVPVSTLHVFARTKGGDPREYYHRTLVFEADWSPWSKLAGVEIAGNHLITFKRSNRLTAAWPVFTLEQDPAQQNKPPPIPDPNNLVADSSSPRLQRLKIQLALSTKDPDTGKWSAKLTSQDGVMWPGPGDIYVSAEQFPQFLNESISLQYVNLEGNLGDLILVCETITTRGSQSSGMKVFGIFNLAGCKGYPEPYHFGQVKNALTRLGFLTFPLFRNTAFEEQRFKKSRELTNSSPSDLAIRTIFQGSNFMSMLGKEYGRFSVTYPTQITIFDRAYVALQLYSMGKSQPIYFKEAMLGAFRVIILSQGTFLPFFVTDSSTRGYFVTTGYESADQTDTNFRTASDTYEFFNRVLKLILKYIDAYYHKHNRNIKALRTELNADQEYNNLKKEFLNVYFNAEDATNMHFRSVKATLSNFYHPLVCLLKSKLYNGGISALLARKTQLSVTEFNFNDAYGPQPPVRQPYPQEKLDFSLSGPYSVYNWELFFHLPFQIAAGFSSDQQFEQARNWYHYIFNPQGLDMEDPASPSEKATAPQKRYWNTNPFFRTQVKDYAEQLIDSILSEVARHPDGFSLADSLKTQIQLWRTNPFSPHAVARARPVAYQASIMLKYIQNLLDWGDQLFTQLTRESITQASTLYMVAEKLLGPKPRTVPPVVSVPVRTYNELVEQKIDLLGNVRLTLENLVPDLGSLPHHGEELPATAPLSSLYFGIPPNTKLLELWDLVADRLFKIRHSQDISGNFISLALTSPPIDPGVLVKALASGASLQDVVNSLNAPLSHYRFSYVLERARNLTQLVVSLGSQLLSHLQRRDEEGLARLRARSEINVLKATRAAKVLAITEHGATIETLRASRAIADTRWTFYNALIKAGLNDFEKRSIEVKDATTLLDVASALGHSHAALSNLVPSFSVGIAGFGGSPNVSMSVGGSNAAASLSSWMAALGSVRNIAETASQLLSTNASYVRRGEEWSFQRALAFKETVQIDKQIAAAEAGGFVLDAELVAHDTNARGSTSTEAYLRSKFSNTELFDWAASRTATTYFQAFQLAFRMAKRAERCMQFELGDFPSTPLVQNGSWDNLRSGLLAGEQLQLDLSRLESAYLETHVRELELTKSVSLARLDPIALLALQTSGKCMFSTPEAIFDLDNPGHYFRRIKSIAISIPCVVGPFTPVSAALRLLSSRYRAKPTDTEAYPEDPPGGDERFVYNVVPPPVMTVASSGANDTGVLDMRPDDPRYLPFEHAGVLGTYSLELPPVHQFDYRAVADAILTISYTARDGGSKLREAAMPAPVGGTSMIALRTAFPIEWNALKAGRAAEPILVSGGKLPHWATAQKRTVLLGVTVWAAMPADGVDLEGLIISIAGANVMFQKAEDGQEYWKGSLQSGKVKYGEKVKLGWKNSGDAEKVAELICVVDFAIDEPAA